MSPARIAQLYLGRVAKWRVYEVLTCGCSCTCVTPVGRRGERCGFCETDQCVEYAMV